MKKNHSMTLLNQRLNTSGQALTEYVTLLMLVALGAVAITSKLGGSIQNAIKKSKNHIDAHLTIEKAQHGRD